MRRFTASELTRADVFLEIADWREASKAGMIASIPWASPCLSAAIARL